MNVKRVLLAGVAAFVVNFAITFALRSGTSLFDWISAGSTQAQRSEAEQLARLPYLMTLALFSYIVFAYLYARTYRPDQGVVGAVTLALILALFSFPTGRVSEWMTYPIDGRVPLAIIPYQFFEGIVAGGVVGLIYKPQQVARQKATASGV